MSLDTHQLSHTSKLGGWTVLRTTPRSWKKSLKSGMCL